jgi:hypothetical protein
MRERKGKAKWSKDIEGLGRRDQVKISRIRTEYNLATHGYIIEKRMDMWINGTETQRDEHEQKHME